MVIGLSFESRLAMKLVIQARSLPMTHKVFQSTDVLIYILP